MKKLAVKILIFVAPFLIFFSVPSYYLLLSEEAFCDLDSHIGDIVNKKRELLIGFSFDERPYKYLKLKTLASIQQQDVVALGSSRVLQFRKEMFKCNFYNAGYTINGINDFLAFLSVLPEKMPRTLIIGLDQWMFNELWDNLKTSTDMSIYKKIEKESLGSLRNKLLKFCKRYFEGRINLKRVHRGPQKPVGLNAYLNSTGFRNDGSMRYGVQIEKLTDGDPSANDFEFNDTFERIKKGHRRFEPCREVNVDALSELEKFLVFCKKNNINVVSFLPPFADSVFDEMKNTGRYVHLDLLPSYLAHVFGKYGYEFYNFNNLKLCGSSDVEALDGFHGSEKTYLKILINMLERNSSLNDYCNLVELKRALSKSSNNFTVYEN